MAIDTAGLEQQASPGAEPYPSPRTAWYAVTVFALALMCAMLDRGIMTLLVQPIKRDLHLTDTEMSLLLGLAFVVFYTFVGLPMSRLVDTRSRKLILAAGIATWSLATACCGLAQNFAQLFLARIGIGAGEAVNGPATYSLMADYFPPHKLPRAIAVLNLGFIAGLGAALIIGAFVIQAVSGLPDLALPLVGTIRNWQLVFFMVGLPGLLVALMMLSVPEPKRRGRLVQGPQRSVPVAEVFRFLYRNRAVYGPMFLALAANSIYAGGLGSWGPTFYQRTYGWSPAQIGIRSGIASLVFAPIGLFLGTWLAERFAREGRDDANLRVFYLAQLAVVPLSIAGPLMPSPWLALGMSALVGLTASMGAPTQNAALQIITPNEMRGQVTALYLFVFSVIGSGVGPLVVSSVTDFVLRDEGQIRYAIMTTAAVMTPLCAVAIQAGLKPYGRAIAALRARGE